MDILEIIKKRRSVRKFSPEPIEGGVVERIIDSLIWAPSAGNMQSRKFYFVFNNQIRRELVLASNNQEFISEAPLSVVCCADDRIEKRYYERGKNLYAICDTAMAAQNLMLFCQEIGLGTVAVGAFDEEKVSKALNIPKNLHPILIIPVGHPAETPETPSRVSAAEAVEKVI